MLGVMFYRECCGKVTFEQRPEEMIGWWQSVPDGGDHRCKGPEVRAGVACLKSSKEGSCRTAELGKG